MPRYTWKNRRSFHCYFSLEKWGENVGILYVYGDKKPIDLNKSDYCMELRIIKLHNFVDISVWVV